MGAGDCVEGPAQLAAAGPRAEGSREDYELLIEAIYEGYLLHYGTPRVALTSDRDLGLLAGDRLYALGLARLVALGDVAAVAELADTITLSALAQGAGAPELADAVWAAGARAIGWGSSEAHRRAKDARARRALQKRSRRCAQAPRASPRRAESRLDIVCARARQAHPAQVQVHRRPDDSRRLRGRDGYATAVHDRELPGDGRDRRGLVPLPALGFALGPIFKQPPHFWQDIGSTEDFTNNNYLPVVITHRRRGSARPASRPHTCASTTPAIDTDPYDRNTPYIAISTRCAHLGCPVRWVDAAERFICPCHGGVYDLLGRRVGGPPVRPLDRFPTRVNGDRGRTVQRAFQRQQRAETLLPARSRGRRSTASASTSTRRAPTRARPTSQTTLHCPCPSFPHPLYPPR